MIRQARINVIGRPAARRQVANLVKWRAFHDGPRDVSKSIRQPPLKSAARGLMASE
jgi:hypothetical protein